MVNDITQTPSGLVCAEVWLLGCWIWEATRSSLTCRAAYLLFPVAPWFTKLSVSDVSRSKNNDFEFRFCCCVHSPTSAGAVLLSIRELIFHVLRLFHNSLACAAVNWTNLFTLKATLGRFVSFPEMILNDLKDLCFQERERF